MVSPVFHVYSPEDIIPTHHCEKFLPGSYFALILDANPSQPNQTKIEAKPVRLIPDTTKLHSSFCLIIKKKKSRNVKTTPRSTYLENQWKIGTIFGFYSICDASEEHVKSSVSLLL